VIEHTYSWIVDGYLRETCDPGYCSVIVVLAAKGMVAATPTDTGFREIEAL
jgi:hypothetical protein